MSGTGIHLCNVQPEIDLQLHDLLKLIKGRQRADDGFKCGVCSWTFQTLCNLHAHFLKHVDCGSYFFDSVTCTAIPKQDTTCAYTQYEPLDFQMEATERDGLIDKNNDSEELNPRQRSFTPKGSIRKRRSNTSNNELRKLVSKRRKSLRLNGEPKPGNQSQAEENNKCIKNVKLDGTEYVGRANTGTISKEITVELEVSNIEDSECTDGLVNVYAKESEDENEADSKNMHGPDSCLDVMSFAHTSADQHKENNSADSCFNVENEDLKEGMIQSVIKTHNNLLDGPTHLPKRCVTTEDVPVSSETTNEDSNQRSDEKTATEALLEISCGSNTFSDKKDNCVERQPSKRKIRKVRRKNEKQLTTTEDGLVPPANTSDTNSNKEVLKQLSPVKIDDPNGSMKKQFQCPVCLKVGSASMMTYHKYIHGDATRACHVCGATFQHPSTLKKHLMQHESKKFRCDLCPAEFHRKQYLVTHCLSHSGERPYLCSTCGKAYRDANNLNRHVRHTHDQVRNFECDICGERFFRIDHMKNHHMRHFEASHKCEFCGKCFKHPTDLSRHLKVHTGDKPFQCPVCKHGFQTVLPYYSHMLKKHNIDRDDAKAMFDKQKKPEKDGIPKVIIRLGSKEKRSDPEALSDSFDNANIHQIGDYDDVLPTTGLGLGKGKLLKDRIKKPKISEDHLFDFDGFDTLESSHETEASNLREQTSRRVADIIKTAHSERSSLLLLTRDVNEEENRKYQQNNGNFQQYEDIHSIETGIKSQETVIDTRGSQFPLQRATSDLVHEGKEEVGGEELLQFVESEEIVGSMSQAEIHLDEGRIVVLGEDSSDLGLLSQFDGDHGSHAVIVDDYEYADEIIIDQC